MPLRNRVTPDGRIIAAAARGTMMGNRGILHDEHRRIVRTHKNIAWLICRLEFNGRRRAVMSPGTYTELFFLDEAVALAAGHRPCAECRRDCYRAFLDAAGAARAGELDRLLDRSRRAPRVNAALDSLPDGVFVVQHEDRHDELRLLWRGDLHRWTPAGYGDPVAATGTAEVITPELTVTALRHGYPVQVHPSAGGADVAVTI
ncbi:hypothetical protein ASE48_23450 [Mycobacterium sp. Root265]|uniref:hypothetical protein n=1 Tax=Mycobacterium sp. Root265 TaxID=1736504 RepID=UPI0007093B91|nr:hypothetical protein [Mycobacterium sp. Root265]KRD19270.1 hypothetical protein ASE48_23450 [Mycobacterium sp. Root265]